MIDNEISINQTISEIELCTCSAPSHYLKQCWVIISWTLRNKLQWKLNQNVKVFIHENASETSSAKWRLFCLGRDELLSTISHEYVTYHIKRWFYAVPIDSAENNYHICLPPAEYHIDGLVQERRNPSALAMDLRLSCTKPSILILLSTLMLKATLNIHWQ